MPHEPSRLPFPRRLRLEVAIVVVAVLFLLLPWLFVSSPDYRQTTTSVFGVAVCCLGWFLPEVRRAAGLRWVRPVIACVFVVHLSSFAGGLRHGAPAARAMFDGLAGMAAVLGFGILTWVLSRTPWRPWTGRTWLAMAVILVVASILGFLVFHQWHDEISKLTPHMDQRRLALVWPTRLLSGELGWQFWSHTNTAAFLFAAFWVLVVDALFRRPKYAPAGWALALLLGTAIFLTASRSAWVMLIAALPLLLVFRGRRFPLQVGLLLGFSCLLGFAAMKHTVARLASPVTHGQPPPIEDIPGKIHVSGLIDRGSSGRMETYEALWADLDGDLLTGHGLSVTRSPILHLLHEHSSYLATLRGGGFPALAAHLFLIGISLLVALQLARRGCRWPLLFAVAVFSGLLFDRSTVFRVTGFEEFPTHWFAVWIPLAIHYRHELSGIPEEEDHCQPAASGMHPHESAHTRGMAPGGGTNV